jgi:hypothetical protein
MTSLNLARTQQAAVDIKQMALQAVLALAILHFLF